ncbi:MAG TPA: dihydrodipicolinate reductase, partial [Thermoanaerobaculia bacterium]
MNKSARARVALVGLGPIGIEVGKALSGRRSLELLGAADPAPDKAGRPLGDLLGTAGGPVVDSTASALYARSAKDRGRADVVILCTGSRLESVTPQIEEAVNAGMHVVSTCEELSFPELKSSALGRRIDERA